VHVYASYLPAKRGRGGIRGDSNGYIVIERCELTVRLNRAKRERYGDGVVAHSSGIAENEIGHGKSLVAGIAPRVSYPDTTRLQNLFHVDRS